MNHNFLPCGLGRGLSVYWRHVVVLLGLALLFGSAAMPAQAPKTFNNQTGSAAEDLPSKRDISPPEYKTIDWPDNSSVNSTLRAKLGLPTISAVDQSLVPVLLPNVVNIGQGTFIKLDAGYSFSLIEPQRFSMVIYAFRLRQPTATTSSTTESQQVGGNAFVRGQIAYSGESEGILRVYWEEFGVRYRLDFSCGVKLAEEECPLAFSGILNALDLAGGNFANP